MVGETKQRIPHTNLYQEWPKSGLRKSDNVGTLYMVPSAVYALDGVEHFPTAFTEVRAPGRHVPAPFAALIFCVCRICESQHFPVVHAAKHRLNVSVVTNLYIEVRDRQR